MLNRRAGADPTDDDKPPVAEAKPPAAAEAAAKPKTTLNLLGLLKAPVKAKVRDVNPASLVLTALYRTCLHGAGGDVEGTESRTTGVFSRTNRTPGELLQLVYV